jgi:hypothetical protein
VVPIGDLQKLDAEVNAAWAGSWFEQRLLVRRLRPVCQISYHRLARVGMRDSGPIRLTLDERLCVMPRADVGFGNGDAMAALPQKMVLELKYRDSLPALFKQLVEEFLLTPRRVSKYRFAVGALGLVPGDTIATPATAGFCADTGDATYA